MRRLLFLCGLAGLCCGLALAEIWSGKLLDASCYEQHKTARSCNATSSTSIFLLDVSGKVYRLDAAGNRQAAQALKNRAERSENPDQPSGGVLNARVAGVKEGEDTLKVDIIEIQ